MEWSRDDIEVSRSQGLGPCRQRNEAAQEAKGDILVFFDNDSCPERDYFRRLAQHFDDPSVARGIIIPVGFISFQQPGTGN